MYILIIMSSLLKGLGLVKFGKSKKQKQFHNEFTQITNLHIYYLYENQLGMKKMCTKRCSQYSIIIYLKYDSNSSSIRELYKE